MPLMAKSPGNRVSANCPWIAYFTFREGNDGGQGSAALEPVMTIDQPVIVPFRSSGLLLGLVDLKDSVGWGLTALRQGVAFRASPSE